MPDDLFFSLQLEKNRVEQLEKFYPNLICTQSLGHVSTVCFIFPIIVKSCVLYMLIQAFPLKAV